MRLRKISRHFLFRYLIVIFLLLFCGLLLWKENDIDRMIILMGVYAGFFPVLVLGWLAFHFGASRYKKKPTPLSLRRGLLYALLPLPMLPLLLFPPAWLVICIVLLWQLGKLTSEIWELPIKNERIPAYMVSLVVFLGVDILLYAWGMTLVFILVFAIGAP